jgi:ELWxxDGT repeat protein
MKERSLKWFRSLFLVWLAALLLAAVSPVQAFYLPALVDDLNPGPTGSNPSQLTVVENTLFFVANDGESGNELWKLDTGGVGPILVKEITPGPAGSSLRGLKNVNGTLYFVLEKELSYGVYERELWKSDGTEAGTVKVAGPFDFIGPLGNIVTMPPIFQAVNSVVYFFAGDYGDYGLWKVGGPAESPERFTDNSLWVYKLGIGKGDVLFFSAEEVVAGVNLSVGQLWQTDGTETGTKAVGATILDRIYPSLSDNTMAVGNDSLFLSAGSIKVGNLELRRVRSDDGHETQSLVANINPDASSDPQHLTFVGNLLFFSADDGNTGRELWVCGQTVAAGEFVVQQVKDIHPGSEGSSPQELTKFDGKLAFAANSFFSASDLYTTDGTPTGTTKLADQIDPRHLCVRNGKLFFNGRNTEYGREMWVSDGTPDGTGRALDMNPGAADSNPNELIVFNDKLYFTATSDTYGREMFRLASMNQPVIGDWVREFVITIPLDRFKRGDRGLRTALVNNLYAADSLVSQGGLGDAIQKLQNIRRHVDGVGNNNWVTNRVTQRELTGKIDGYINELNSLR